MPNLSLTRVNQKLAQAKALLNDVDEVAFGSLHVNSIKEAAAFHLMCAYQHYLHEIAETYWLKNVASIRTEDELIVAFHAAKKHPTEPEELKGLREDGNSWLGQLHAYYESLWSIPVNNIREARDEDILIKAVNLESNFDIANVDVTIIACWNESFVELVTRQRETSCEF